MKGQRRLFGIGALLLLIGVAPLAIAIATQLLAEGIGCGVSESGASACLVGGVDIGEALYTGFMMGFLVFLSAPVFLAGLVVLLIAAIRSVAGIVRRR